MFTKSAITRTTTNKTCCLNNSNYNNNITTTTYKTGCLNNSHHNTITYKTC